ncbi:MAG: MFS transporter [Chloroflexi bacterium]|nr:MFS transporter [Chloroflexota bacterium]
MSRRWFYGWTIVAVAMAGMFASTITGGSVYTVFIRPLEEDFGWSRAFVSGVTTAGAIGGGVLSPFTGILIGRFGLRRVLITGSMLASVTGFTLALSQNGWQFYLSFVTQRMVTEGVLGLGLMAMVSNWFIAKRGRAIGFVLGGGYAGASLVPLIAYAIIQASSWRYAFGFGGILFVLFMLVPIALFARQRPEERGLLPDGRAAGEATTPSGAPARKTSPSPDAESNFSVRQAVRTPVFWLLMVILFIVYLVHFGMVVHLVPLLKESGFKEGLAAAMVAVMAVVRFGGNLVWGFLAERISIRACLIALTALAAASLSAMYQMSNLAQAVGLIFFWAFNFAGLITMEWLVIPHYFGRKHFASIRGLAGPFLWAGAACGPLIGGFIFDATESYDWAVITYAGLCVVAVLAALLLRKPKAPATTSD